MFSLFDTLIEPVLNYGCEVWGFSPCIKLERLHLKFLREQFHLKVNTVSDIVYCECARVPLIYIRYLKILKFWVKLLDPVRKNLCNQLFLQQLDFVSPWRKNLENLLNNIGLDEVWAAGGPANPKLFLLDVKSRLFSYARKFMFQRINTSRKCITYKCICPHMLEGKLPNYLCASVNDRSIIHIVRFKARNHYLRIETGSWARPRIVPEERVCPVCMVVEDELHTVLICPLYSTLREHYIAPEYCIAPSLDKFCNLFNSSDTRVLNNLGFFLGKMQELHQSLFSS